MINMKARKIGLVFLILMAGISGFTFANEQPIIGKLGKPVGTELTIEGTFQGGKNSWILVTKVNEKELSSPVLIATSLDTFEAIKTDAGCRFKGMEVTYVVKPVIDPTTGKQGQQAAPGRHLAFKVTKVLVPKGVKIRKEEESNNLISWGEGKNGISCGISLSKPSYVLGEDVEVSIFLRNNCNRELKCNVRGIGSWRNIENGAMCMDLVFNEVGDRRYNGTEYTVPNGKVCMILVQKFHTRPLNNPMSDLHFTPGEKSIIVQCDPRFEGNELSGIYSGIATVEVVELEAGNSR